MGIGICVHYAHVVNTVSPILPEVTDQEVSLLFCGLWRRRVVYEGCACGTGRLCLRPLRGATCKDEEVVAYVRGGEGFTGQVRDPFPELVMTCRDKAAPITIEDVEILKFGVAAVTIMGGGLGALGHIVGIGHLTIPAHPVLSSLQWTTAPSARPQSLSPVSVNHRLIEDKVVLNVGCNSIINPHNFTISKKQIC